MEKEKLLMILNELNKVCEEVNKANRIQNKNNKVQYEVLQFSDLAKKWDSAYQVADFYNDNWLGNADFMHIPNFIQTLENCNQYPIIIAREEGKDELLGISTIKYNENTNDHIDPYFPEENAKYFSITGILTKRNNPYRGIGKKIYEIALRGAYQYEKHYPGTRIMCVIDCRNNHSLKALATAVENIKQQSIVGERMELPANIAGYYELRDANHHLLEAPTLVMEVGLQSKKSDSQDSIEQRKNIEYHQEEGKELFESLLNTLKKKLKKYGINPPVENMDADCGKVYYYSLEDKKKCKLHGINIEPNGTEQGNDRKKIEDETKRIMGPFKILKDDEQEK